MRGRGGGEGGLGTISSELLLWVSMARERRGEGRLRPRPPSLTRHPPCLTSSPGASQPHHCYQDSQSGAGTVSGKLGLLSQTWTMSCQRSFQHPITPAYSPGTPPSKPERSEDKPSDLHADRTRHGDWGRSRPGFPAPAPQGSLAPSPLS